MGMCCPIVFSPQSVCAITATLKLAAIRIWVRHDDCAFHHTRHPKMIAGKSLSPVLKAVLWMAVALLSFTAMAVAVRELAGEMHAFEILFIPIPAGLKKRPRCRGAS